MRHRADLFVASVLVLFLELACIRWFPAHVLFLTFFTNVMLLASFLGISVGCLAAGMSADTIAGQIQATFIGMGGSLPFVQTGRLRALVVTSAKRSAALPMITTAKDFMAA